MSLVIFSAPLRCPCETTTLTPETQIIVVQYVMTSRRHVLLLARFCPSHSVSREARNDV
jgi:hypothetical protein